MSVRQSVGKAWLGGIDTLLQKDASSLQSLAKAALLSLLPVAELRGGIPLALLLGIHPILAYAVCVLANLVVVPLVYVFLERIHHHLMPIRIYREAFDRYVGKTRKRLHTKVEKWGYLGLTIFVAIPLPVTGAYTGTLGAWFFGMNKVKSFLAIALGVSIAGLIVTTVVLSGNHAYNMFIRST